VITDPVHGDVNLSRLEVAVVDSRPFQRLRRVRQLGNSHLVYPGAVHSRFSHSLGTVKAAQFLLDQVRSQQYSLRPTPDLLSQWRRQGHPAGQHISVFDSNWAEATVLARLGALLHDLCHVPAGHTVEDDLRLLDPHDKNLRRFRRLWTELRKDVLASIEASPWGGQAAAQQVAKTLLNKSGPLYAELEPLILSKLAEGKPSKYLFCRDLVGNTICADLLDYLERDHLYTGLPEALGKRFMSAFFVVPEGDGVYERRLALNIQRRSSERIDVVSELLKALRYRYELTERVLVHKTKLAADAMLGEALERWEWALWYRAASEIGLVDRAQLAVDERPELIPEARGELAGHESRKVTKDVTRTLDEELSEIGDDELLARLTSLRADDYPDEISPLIGHVADLGRALISRDLFKVVGQTDSRDAPAEKLYKCFGDASSRAEIEASAHHFAGITGGPKLVIWLPDHKMRLKLAEVLVRHEKGVSPFVAYERAGSKRGSEIYDAHARLWKAYVFAHRSLLGTVKLEEALAFLEWRMGIQWGGGQPPTPRPTDRPLALALEREIQRADLEGNPQEVLERHRDEFADLAARDAGEETFTSLSQKVRKILVGLDLPSA